MFGVFGQIVSLIRLEWGGGGGKTQPNCSRKCKQVEESKRACKKKHNKKKRDRQKEKGKKERKGVLLRLIYC